MKTRVVTESKWTPLELHPDEATALQLLGRSLASKSARPGFEDEEDQVDRTVIRCRKADEEGVYDVRVSDAVGVIGVLNRLQIEVQPKIPLNHLIYLMKAADVVPRLDEQAAEVQADEHFLKLIARWYVKATEKLLRRGMIKDYSPRHEFSSAKRGRLHAVGTARAYYSGRIGFQCEFDEFDTDTELNRVVREGASVVVRSAYFGAKLRREALRIRNRMDGVGAVQVGDLRAQVDRRAGHYQPALPLAKQLIRAEGRSLRGGSRATWSFLVRTPDMVEEGLRNVLRNGLAPRWAVDTGYARAEGANIGFYPDLEFGHGIAVGDVKYKLQGADWNRGDLNQIVTFVAAYGCRRGAVFKFRESTRNPLPAVGVGEQQIRSITWPFSDGITPEAAAQKVVDVARAWLVEIGVKDLEVA